MEGMWAPKPEHTLFRVHAEDPRSHLDSEKQTVVGKIQESLGSIRKTLEAFTGRADMVVCVAYLSLAVVEVWSLARPLFFWCIE